ncbi:hypothetical protein BC936DRAFT_143303 [Jimgerdemannia flammicorona]|uniref:Uncharacterized protein n=1 Tax=Jimgerdemannia flammicorona TaxID=994334 RepID=A0A433DE21_9FUNG|nr:hypothetical protein BC936DRAFT_143303 [Jimgerdemannia flammicorona]
MSDVSGVSGSTAVSDLVGDSGSIGVSGLVGDSGSMGVSGLIGDSGSMGEGVDAEADCGIWTIKIFCTFRSAEPTRVSIVQLNCLGLVNNRWCDILWSVLFGGRMSAGAAARADPTREIRKTEQESALGDVAEVLDEAALAHHGCDGGL